MPILSIRIPPGINVEKTDTLNEGAWSYSNLIRWKDGLVQKYGGWTRYYSGTIGSAIRALHAWTDLSNVSRLAVGAASELTVITSGSAYTITPQATTSNNTVNFATVINTPTVTIVDTGSNTSINDVVQIQTQVSIGGIVLFGLYPVVSVISANSYTITAAANATSTVVAPGGAVPSFTTTASSSVVTVTLNNHGLAVGGTFPIAVATTIGGITLSGFYTVATVTSANVFTINSANQAGSGATVSENSGNARLTYWIGVGAPPIGSGWGSVGGWGGGGWGLGSVGSPRTGTPITATDWTLDNAGSTLVACPANGPVFTWSPDGGFSTANILPKAPTANSGIFLAMPAQILVAYGAEILGVQDPLLIRWSDVSNFGVWTAASGNQAGQYRLATGSYIVGALQGPQQSYVWTDLGVWAMQYIGYPGVFGFNEIGRGCGLIAKHAAGVLGSDVFWLSKTQFFAASSGSSPQPINCSVWDFLFQNLNTTYVTNIRCAVNSKFQEVMWFFPTVSSVSGENDAYVKMTKTEEGLIWDYGMLARSAWIDQNVLGSSIGATSGGVIYLHESGNDADGVAMDSYAQTGYMMISEGTNSTFIDQIIPDFQYGLYSGTQAAQVQVTLYATDFPNQTPRTFGPYTCTSASTLISTRTRARQIALKIESTDIGSFWRVGNIRYRGAPDGRR